MRFADCAGLCVPPFLCAAAGRRHAARRNETARNDLPFCRMTCGGSPRAVPRIVHVRHAVRRRAIMTGRCVAGYPVDRSRRLKPSGAVFSRELARGCRFSHGCRTTKLDVRFKLRCSNDQPGGKGRKPPPRGQLSDGTRLLQRNGAEG